MIKYFVDKDGNYIGCFSGIKKPVFDKKGKKTGDKEIWPDFPIDGIEVAIPPQDSRQKWDGKKWLPYDNYAEKRQPEYPPIGDQLDAIMKWAASSEVPEELKSVAQACMAVKDKYPKPSE